MVIRHIGVWSAARMYAAISGAAGLFFGFCIAALSMIGAGFAAPGDDTPAWLAPVFGMGAIVALPLFYAIMGLVAGAIGALIYNLFAGMVGGLEIDVQ
jgi:hypothetical protein